MRGPRTPEANLRPRHARVEHYTPDGPLGRLLLAVATGSVGGSALFFAIASVVNATPFWPILALLASGLGFAGVGLALVVLWPVYLSLIGNVESASEYAEGGAVRPPGRAAEFDASAGAADPDDAVAVLKRRYAAGDISESEFERRLDDLLGVEEVLDARRESSGRARGDRTRDAERN